MGVWGWDYFCSVTGSALRALRVELSNNTVSFNDRKSLRLKLELW